MNNGTDATNSLFAANHLIINLGNFFSQLRKLLLISKTPFVYPNLHCLQI